MYIADGLTRRSTERKLVGTLARPALSQDSWIYLPARSARFR